ncbi:hypothetical protein, partial [Paraburkholderia tropica]|uniref:hypothetical protein n=1 Tax=Paraburkholderia tropica TaxID=92647 RepID=UPI001C8555A7
VEISLAKSVPPRNGFSNLSVKLCPGLQGQLHVIGIGSVNEVDIKVAVDASKGRVVAGYPTNLPRNPK